MLIDTPPLQATDRIGAIFFCLPELLRALYDVPLRFLIRSTTIFPMHSMHTTAHSRVEG
jgi:hypothetical protein